MQHMKLHEPGLPLLGHWVSGIHPNSFVSYRSPGMSFPSYLAGTSAELLTALECADQVWKAETSLYANIFKAYVPQQPALAAAKIHSCVGAGLLPWVRQGKPRARKWGPMIHSLSSLSFAAFVYHLSWVACWDSDMPGYIAPGTHQM